MDCDPFGHFGDLRRILLCPASFWLLLDFNLRHFSSELFALGLNAGREKGGHPVRKGPQRDPCYGRGGPSKEEKSLKASPNTSKTSPSMER